MNEQELLEHVLKDAGAIQFIKSLHKISQVWDDLVDKDKPVSREQIDGAFRLALIEIPQNPFYLFFIGKLLPVMESVIYDWQTATVMEQGDELMTPFILRDSLAGIIVYCAGLLYGPEWALNIAPTVRKWVHDEDFTKYVEEHQHA